MIRETSIPESLVEPTRGLTDNLRDVPRLLWDDKRLRTFVYARMFTMGIFIMTPFLAIHTLEVTGKTESYLGFLVAAQMTGGILSISGADLACAISASLAGGDVATPVRALRKAMGAAPAGSAPP